LTHQVRRVFRAIADHDTPRLFDWLMLKMSYQGIADQIAESYIAQHGNVRWRDIERLLAKSPTCPKLSGYWLFHGCRYQKGSVTCAEPGHLAGRPLPSHPLRNGNLNNLPIRFDFGFEMSPMAILSPGLTISWPP
jgi:hypothetical protein